MRAAMLRFRRTHFLRAWKFRCGVLEWARALASVASLEPAQARTGICARIFIEALETDCGEVAIYFRIQQARLPRLGIEQ
jgi:hypothetical protein